MSGIYDIRVHYNEDLLYMQFIMRRGEGGRKRYEVRRK
jgi:hypothetical protein